MPSYDVYPPDALVRGRTNGRTDGRTSRTYSQLLGVPHLRVLVARRREHFSRARWLPWSTKSLHAHGSEKKAKMKTKPLQTYCFGRGRGFWQRVDPHHSPENLTMIMPEKFPLGVNLWPLPCQFGPEATNVCDAIVNSLVISHVTPALPSSPFYDLLSHGS